MALFGSVWLTLAVLIGALATWRLAAFLYFDNGPFSLMGRTRQAIQQRGGWLLDQFACFWCLSLWAGLVIAPLALICWPILLPLALSGAALLLSQGGRTIWRAMQEE